MAILSMDANNRGYSLGIAVSGTQIGSATFTLGSDQPSTGIPEGVAAGFYAAAYTTQWGTVISYLGTNFEGGPATNDVLNG